MIKNDDDRDEDRDDDRRFQFLFSQTMRPLSNLRFFRSERTDDAYVDAPPSPERYGGQVYGGRMNSVVVRKRRLSACGTHRQAVSVHRFFMFSQTSGASEKSQVFRSTRGQTLE